MSSALTVAEPSDINALVAFRREFCIHEEIAFDEDVARSVLNELVADPSLGRVFLIHINGGLAGYLVLTFGYSLEFHGRDAFIDELYVMEDHRGQGLGKQAICHAEEACIAAGIRAIHIEVDHQNHRAQAVYGAAGFVDRENYLLTKVLSIESDDRHVSGTS